MEDLFHERSSSNDHVLIVQVRVWLKFKFKLHVYKLKIEDFRLGAYC